MPYTLKGLDLPSFMKKYRAQFAYQGPTVARGTVVASPLSSCVPGPTANSKQYPSNLPFSIEVKTTGLDATITVKKDPGYETGV